MFIGSFTYSLDAKSRVAIPAKLRKYVNPEANDTFILTRGTSQCIDVYPLDKWNELVQHKLNKLDSFDPKEAMFLRMFLQKAAEDSLDAQSRLIIPQNLVEFAKIEKEVFILGAINRIELWNPAIYEKYLNDQTESFENIAKEVMTMIK
ncbi:MAG TPA: division/cell wall cluster transcriptional repressor MraZ [Ignavibacteriales bacterium]|nr:division/cell wall cluster transcriptional repressor MraZ [Ignavibacteriales bacterium]